MDAKQLFVAELTPADRARFVRNIAKIGPYDEDPAPRWLLTDLLADLRHFADAEHLSFTACDQAARGHYIQEIHCYNERDWTYTGDSEGKA